MAAYLPSGTEKEYPAVKLEVHVSEYEIENVVDRKSSIRVKLAPADVEMVLEIEYPAVTDMVFVSPVAWITDDIGTSQLRKVEVLSIVKMVSFEQRASILEAGFLFTDVAFDGKFRVVILDRVSSSSGVAVEISNASLDWLESAAYAALSMISTRPLFPQTMISFSVNSRRDSGFGMMVAEAKLAPKRTAQIDADFILNEEEGIL
jgi:hypothetical protein